jgi:hypothetical protein
MRTRLPRGLSSASDNHEGEEKRKLRGLRRKDRVRVRIIVFFDSVCACVCARTTFGSVLSPPSWDFLKYRCFAEMIADLLTKPCAHAVFQRLVDYLLGPLKKLGSLFPQTRSN